MTEQEFSTWTRHTAENLIAQRDEAVSAVAAIAAERDAEIAKGAAAVLKAKEDAVTALSEAQDKAATATAAALKEVTDRLEGEAAELKATLAAEQAAHGQTAIEANTQISAAATRIVELEAQVAALAAQLAGKAGEYKVTTSAFQEVTLNLVSGGDPAAWVNAQISAMLDGLVKENQKPLLALALEKYPTLPAEQKAAVLEIFDLGDLAGAPVDKQLAVFRDLGLARFEVLPNEKKAIIGSLLAGA